MKHNSDFNSEIQKIKKENLFRKLRNAKVIGSEIIIDGKKLLNLSSNDYLGIPQNKIKISQLQSSSRLISGNDDCFSKLENKLARHKSQKSALIFPTGYMTNLGIIPTITNKKNKILSDSLNHASIIEACKLSNADITIFKHNDMKDLEKKCNDGEKAKIIITEGVFSMDGDYANLKEISEISKRNNAMLIVDDAHGDFVLGRDGKGTPNKFNVEKDVDVYISSLSKGLGSFGGYVASKKNVIDLCVNKSKSFIYTSALPSFLVQNSLDRFEMDREGFRKKLLSNVNYFISGLKEIGYEINSESHIIPIMIGNERKSVQFGRYLFKNGIFVQPIRYPTVKKGQARMRLSITSWIKPKQIDLALDVFKKAKKHFKI